MADLNALKQKYQPVIDVIQKFSAEGAKVEDVSLAGEQLHLKATVPSKVVLNRVWDEIKKVDPNYADLKHEIINTGGDTQSYTIQNGDNLSRISQRFYGDAKFYNEIVKANHISDPDKIRAGEQIQIPARAA
ncbi:MAG: LysM peptidoglycan-binding domain-containing protein [Acidobacteria bacterium]|nr:LysM peptidoglycan-binding domain-containing protein [Acidobacteriota bacterium]